MALQKPVTGIIFDIDQTLYNHEVYYQSQQRILIEQLARELGKPYSKTLELIETYRLDFSRQHPGKEQSLGNTLLHFGITFSQHLAWRNELFRPEDHLTYDKELVITLTIISNKCLMTAVTNNPEDIGRRTLVALGIEEFFLTVFGLDTTGVSKPSMIPFECAARAMHKPYREILSVGDRMSVDIELPVQAGMSGILVESVNDVYRLPEFLG